MPDIHKTAELIQEIAASSGEQKNGVEQIGKAINQLDQAVQQNAAASEELASTAEEFSGQAEQMQETMQYFKVDDGDPETSPARKETPGPKRATKIAHMTRATIDAAYGSERGPRARPAQGSVRAPALRPNEAKPTERGDEAFEEF